MGRPARQGKVEAGYLVYDGSVRRLVPRVRWISLQLEVWAVGTVRVLLVAVLLIAIVSVPGLLPRAGRYILSTAVVSAAPAHSPALDNDDEGHHHGENPDKTGDNNNNNNSNENDNNNNDNSDNNNNNNSNENDNNDNNNNDNGNDNNNNGNDNS
jgi:hypothetical protein